MEIEKKAKVHEITEATGQIASLKKGLVVEKTEQVNHESGDVEYSVTFAAESEDQDEANDSNSIIVRVMADKRFFDRFKVNREYDMNFLERMESSKAERAN
jgi:hypothetical protein